jgi:DNA repair exonuclease SbcCD ATPase subunit|tara:strand:- start:1734 stop:3530 length:1797 start_codon:yes stop_codon:yes gene_type:complete
MITLRTLKWDNCFSYGSGNELQLDDNTVTQILGTNGMGKSSIPLIIEEALYNKNSKGIKKADIPNRYVNDGYNICLAFTKDDDRYIITVNRKTSIKVKLEKNDSDISSHTATNTYKTLQEVLGVDFKTFSQLVYQNTNASLQFLTATDANRKKFLIDLLHLEKYVELFEVFKGASREVSSTSATIAGKLATVEKWLETNKLSDTTILPMLNLEIDTSNDEKALSSLTAEIANISEKNKKITTNNQYKMLLDQIDIAAIQSSEVTQYESYDDLQEEFGNVKAVAAGAQRTLKKLEELKEVCPTCKQSIDVSAEKAMIAVEQTKYDEAVETISSIKPKILRIKTRNLEFERNATAQKDWEDLVRSFDSSLPRVILDKQELEEKRALIEESLTEAKRLRSDNYVENERRTRLNTRIQVIQEQTAEFVEQQEEYDGKLLGNQKLEAELDTLKKSFSTNGLLAYKIENLVGELEELANEYLAELSDGRFTLEFVVSNDKLNVQITDNGNVVDILALSSGELARVNTATLIAIRKLMSSISKSKINVLFLDEVTNVLDDQGREKLVEVLLREDMNTYIVSHGWSHPLLEKIEVVKDGNISTLEK